jgi:predicted RNA methylase
MYKFTESDAVMKLKQVNVVNSCVIRVLVTSSPSQDQHVADAESGCASMSVSVAAVPAPQVLGCEDHSPATAKWLKLLVLKVRLS